MIKSGNSWAWALLLLMLLFLGCKSQQAQSDAEEGTASLDPTVIREGSNCGITQAGHYFIEDQQSWQDLWQRLVQGQVPSPALPEVDFEKEVVVAFFMGEQNRGGYAIEIAEVVQQGSVLKLSLIYQEPGPNCFATMAMTQPFLVVKFDQPGIERIEFDTRQEKTEC